MVSAPVAVAATNAAATPAAAFGGGFGFGSFATTTAATTTKAENDAEEPAPVQDTKILPETFEVRTGEEDEEVILGPMKCKIFKYVSDVKSVVPEVTGKMAPSSVPPSKSEDEQDGDDKDDDNDKKTSASNDGNNEAIKVWKPFGTGEIKILQHKVTNNVRLVQRNGGTTIVLNERLTAQTVKLTTPSDQEARLMFCDSCRTVALKVAKENFASFLAALRPHVVTTEE